MMAVVASEPGPFQKAVLQHPDVQKAISMIRDQAANFPERDSPAEWALLRNADPGEAEKSAEAIRKSPRRLLQQSIATLLQPSSAGEALETYWIMQIMGKPEEGRQALRKVAAMGIPLPIVP
jgi:alkanesulfonate monooxygenase SsuD/methylene tetrahydromethanopterin reductase-like flavin-dependent oxidoreductase (luciferase family)